MSQSLTGPRLNVAAAWGRIAGRTFSLLLYHGSNRRGSLPIHRHTMSPFMNPDAFCGFWFPGSKKIFQRSEIVLTTYDIFRIEFNTFNEVDWLVIMFDEIHKIKDRKTKLAHTLLGLKCLRRYGLTGTVVQNKYDRLSPVLSFSRSRADYFP